MILIINEFFEIFSKKKNTEQINDFKLLLCLYFVESELPTPEIIDLQ